VTYREHSAPPALAASVACFWTAQRSQALRILPDGCVDILFDLHGGPARVAGVMTRAIVTPTGPSSSWLGVRFKSGSALGMLGLYVDVASLDGALKSVPGAEVIVPVRTTFYGAHEAAVRDTSGQVVIFSEHPR